MLKASWLGEVLSIVAYIYIYIYTCGKTKCIVKAMNCMQSIIPSISGLQSNPLRFRRQRYGGHVGGKHAPNTIAADDDIFVSAPPTLMRSF
jgi:hypothetical protein